MPFVDGFWYGREEGEGELHRCAEQRACEEIRESLEPRFHEFGWAITDIIRPNGCPVWLAENGEYSTVIAYCPFCGAKLP